MHHAYPVVFHADQNDTIIASVPDVPGAMTVGKDRAEALERLHGALVTMLAACVDDRLPIPRASRPARGQRTVSLSPIAAAKVSVYDAMRAARLTRRDLRKRLGWEEKQLSRLLDLRRRSRLEDLDAALGALGKRLVIDVQNAA